MIPYIQNYDSKITGDLFKLLKNIDNLFSSFQTGRFYESSYAGTEHKSGLSVKYYSHTSRSIDSYLNRSSYYYRECIQNLDKLKTELEETQSKKAEQYWLSHPEEKNQLEKEMSRLLKEISSVYDNVNSSAEKAEKDNLEKELKNLNSKRKALGLFAISKKKDIDKLILDTKSKLSDVESRLNALNDKAEEKRTMLMDQLMDTKDKIKYGITE